MSWSRLDLVGDYILETPLRISTGESVLLDGEGRPVIPASSFRGALRAYLESVLRGIRQPETRRTVTLRGADGRPMPTSRTVKLCCDSVDKRQDDANYQGCLTHAIVSRWEADPVLKPQLDSALIDCSCQMCRLFGAPWLAGRVMVSDLQVRPESWNGSFARRGGLAISRDRDIMIDNSAYQRDAVPAGTRFGFRLLLETATPDEQGLILLGLRAFAEGGISLGADRARGLGRGMLVIDWANCRFVDPDRLIGAILNGDSQSFTQADAEARIGDLAAKFRTP